MFSISNASESEVVDSTVTEATAAEQDSDPEVKEVEKNETALQTQNTNTLQNSGTEDWHTKHFSVIDWDFTISKIGEDPVQDVDFKADYSNQILTIFTPGLKLEQCEFRRQKEIDSPIIVLGGVEFSGVTFEITMEGVNASSIKLSTSAGSYNTKINFVENTTSSFLALQTPVSSGGNLELAGPGKLIIDDSSGSVQESINMPSSSLIITNGVNVDMKVRNITVGAAILANNISILNGSVLHVMNVNPFDYEVAISSSNMLNISDNSEFYAYGYSGAFVFTATEVPTDIDLSNYLGSNDKVAFSDISQVNKRLYICGRPILGLDIYEVVLITKEGGDATDTALTVYKAAKNTPQPDPTPGGEEATVSESAQTGDCIPSAAIALIAIIALGSFIALRSRIFTF